MPRPRGMAAFVRDGYGAFRRPKFRFGSCEMFVLRNCSVKQNFYVFSLYRNTDLDDRIVDYLLTSMAAVQTEDVRTSFRFVGDLNGHKQEWLGYTTTNRHVLAIFDFATVSGYDQLVVDLTHSRGGTFDLMITDVLDLVRVAVVTPIVNSDQASDGSHFDGSGSSKLVFSWKVFLKQ